MVRATQTPDRSAGTSQPATTIVVNTSSCYDGWVRVEAHFAIVTISVAVLAATHPHALRASSSMPWSPWSTFQGRPKEFFERVSDVLRGVLLGGIFGGAYSVTSLNLPVPLSVVIGSLGGVVLFVLFRRLLKELLGLRSSPPTG